MATMFKDECKKLPPLPDFILEKMGGADFVKMAHQIGFEGPEAWRKSPNKSVLIADPGNKTPSQTYITQELKQSILSGDYGALATARNQNVSDLQPNMTTINNAKNWSDAYVSVTNPSNGQEYWIVASDNGWIWHYTTQINSNRIRADDGKIHVSTQCVVQSGSYTAGGKILGLSYQTLTNIPTDVTALAAAMIVSSLTFNFVKQYILGAIFDAALQNALAAAAADAVAGGFMVDAAAAGIIASIGAGLAAGVIGAIIAVIIFYVVDWLHRSYGLTISIYNWDTKATWNITSWYGDNAVVSQETKADGPWKQAALLPVQNSVPGPFGPIPANNPVAQYASYAYTNNNEWLEGLGVAMQLTSNGASFYLGYDVRRLANNLIALSSDTSQAMDTWYNSPSTWQPSGSQSYTTTLSGRPDLSVTCITTSLNGDQAYSYEVHIGLQQSQ